MKNGQRKAVILILALITIIGLGLRTINIGHLNFWVDELNHVYAAKNLLEESAPVLPSGQEYNRAFIYSTLVAASFHLFGIGESQARLPSIIFGIISILLIFFIGLRWFSPWVGIIASFLLAFSPYAVGWSRECRMYTLFQAVFLVFIYFLYKGFEYQSPGKTDSNQAVISWYRLPAQWGIHWGYILLASIAAVLSFHIHKLTAILSFGLLGYFALLFLDSIRPGRTRDGLWLKYLTPLLLSSAVFLVGHLFFDISDRLLHALQVLPAWASVKSMYHPGIYLKALPKSLMPFFLIGVVAVCWKRSKPGLLLFSFFLIPFLMHEFLFALKSFRYIFHLYACFLLLAAYGINLTFKEITTRIQPYAKGFSPLIVGLLFAVLLVNMGWFKWGLRIPWAEPGESNGAATHYEWETACHSVKALIQPEDTVVSTIPLTALYYGIPRVDYALNHVHLQSARNKRPGKKLDRYIDHYSPAELIQDFSSWKKIISNDSRVWIIADKHRLEATRYVPSEIKENILTSFQRQKEIDNPTVWILKREIPGYNSQGEADDR